MYGLDDREADRVDDVLVGILIAFSAIVVVIFFATR